MIDRATNRDWQIVFPGCPIPGYWVGFVSRSEYMIEGLGGFFLTDCNRYWMFVRVMPGVRKPVLLHKMARLTIAIAEEAGIRLWAQCDERFARSSVWLARLGFVKTDEAINGVNVWVRR
jgi:hypothetical protein